MSDGWDPRSEPAPGRDVDAEPGSPDPPAPPASWDLARQPEPAVRPEAPDRIHGPQRLHPSTPALGLVLVARQALLPIVLLLVSGGSLLGRGGAVLAVAAVVVAWQVMAWRRFTYGIDGDVLRIEHGVFNRNRREVPINRIQQVDLQRKLRHRALGVAVVRVDTAGGAGGAEVELEAISDDDAIALRRYLLLRAGRPTGSAYDLATRHEGPPVPVQAAPGSPVPAGGDHEALGGAGHLHDPGTPQAAPAPPAGRAPEGAVDLVSELGLRDLIVAGVTGSRLGAALPIAGVLVALSVELPESVAREVGDQVGTAASNGLAVAAFLLLLLPFVLITAALSSVFTDHGYTLVRVGDDLHLRRGLLDQREATLSLHRVQVVRVFDNPVRRRMGAVAVQLQSAGSGSSSEGDVTRLTIPLVRLHDLDRVLDLVLPGSVPAPALVPAPSAARRRLYLRRLASTTVVLAMAVIVVVAGLGWTWWAAAILVLLLPVAAVAEQAYRGLGHAAVPGFVFARRGGLARETVVVPVAKAQSSRLVSSPFQRRLGLATLQLGVAGTGRTPAVIDGEYARLDLLRHAALYTVAARVDEDAVRRRARGEAVASAEAAPVPTGG